jgi:hypothetical protein
MALVVVTPWSGDLLQIFVGNFVFFIAIGTIVVDVCWIWWKNWNYQDGINGDDVIHDIALECDSWKRFSYSLINWYPCLVMPAFGITCCRLHQWPICSGNAREVSGTHTLYLPPPPPLPINTWMNAAYALYGKIYYWVGGCIVWFEFLLLSVFSGKVQSTAGPGNSAFYKTAPANILHINIINMKFYCNLIHQ